MDRSTDISPQGDTGLSGQLLEELASLDFEDDRFWSAGLQLAQHLGSRSGGADAALERLLDWLGEPEPQNSQRADKATFILTGALRNSSDEGRTWLAGRLRDAAKQDLPLSFRSSQLGTILGSGLAGRDELSTTLIGEQLESNNAGQRESAVVMLSMRMEKLQLDRKPELVLQMLGERIAPLLRNIGNYESSLPTLGSWKLLATAAHRSPEELIDIVIEEARQYPLASSEAQGAIILLGLGMRGYVDKLPERLLQRLDLSEHSSEIVLRALGLIGVEGVEATYARIKTPVTPEIDHVDLPAMLTQYGNRVLDYLLRKSDDLTDSGAEAVLRVCNAFATYFGSGELNAVWSREAETVWERLSEPDVSTLLLRAEISGHAGAKAQADLFRGFMEDFVLPKSD